MSDIRLERPSTASLVGDALKQVTSLFSAELRLARLELTEKVTLAVASIAGVAVAAVFSLLALIFLLAGVVELLIHFGLEPFVANFIVGGVLLLIALIAVIFAMRNLSASHLKPERTIRQATSVASRATGGSQ